MPNLPHMSPSAPVSPVYQEAYWAGGAAEKSFVFLRGNGLPQRMAGQPFTVAELGFGTGLTFLLTAQLAAQTATPLTFISYELHPLAPAELAVIHQALPASLSALSAAFLAHYRPAPGWNTLQVATSTLHLYVGDAATGMRTHPQPAEAWFLDGFSPVTNPAMWTPELLTQVYAHTVPGGTATTYSAARAVKDALTQAGFTWRREKGFPPKWHMLKATKI